MALRNMPEKAGERRGTQELLATVNELWVELEGRDSLFQDEGAPRTGEM